MICSPCSLNLWTGTTRKGIMNIPPQTAVNFGFLTDPFAYGNKVKMDLFKKYGALAAAGDRRLVEFLNNKWYLSSPPRRF